MKAKAMLYHQEGQSIPSLMLEKEEGVGIFVLNFRSGKVTMADLMSWLEEIAFLVNEKERL